MPWDAPSSYGSRDVLNGDANWNQTRDTFPNMPWHLTVETEPGFSIPSHFGL
jgi:hypothetical protein